MHTKPFIYSDVLLSTYVSANHQFNVNHRTTCTNFQLALILNVIDAVTLNLWPVYVPCLIEESLIVTLTVMKFVYSKSDIPTDLSPNKTTALASDSTGKRNDETERVDVERSMKADNIENEEKV